MEWKSLSPSTWPCRGNSELPSDEHSNGLSRAGGADTLWGLVHIQPRYTEGLKRIVTHNPC
ncbi:hypothetical protein D3C78_1490980 [compost metagenome]